MRIGRGLGDNTMRIGWQLGENQMSGGAPVFQFEILNVSATQCTREARTGVQSYILFLMRSFVRSSVRKNRLFSNCFKSRELASRANTKVICKKMTLFLSYFFANYLTQTNSRELSRALIALLLLRFISILPANLKEFATFNILAMFTLLALRLARK